MDPLLALDAAADELGVSRPFVRQQALAATLPPTAGPNEERMVRLSDLLAWHEGMRERQRTALVELGAELDQEIARTDANGPAAGGGQ